MRAMCERSFYRTAVKSSRDVVHDHFTEDGVLTLPSPGSALPSGSGPNTVHYSFDFAQQVHYPDNPLQPGPMYFNSLHATGLYIDYMNNSLAKKEIMKRKKKKRERDDSRTLQCRPLSTRRARYCGV